MQTRGILTVSSNVLLLKFRDMLQRFRGTTLQIVLLTTRRGPGGRELLRRTAVQVRPVAAGWRALRRVVLVLPQRILRTMISYGSLEYRNRNCLQYCT